MFVAERATNIILLTTFGGSMTILHVFGIEVNLFLPEGQLVFPVRASQAKGK